jgi:hypothetical protein
MRDKNINGMNDLERRSSAGRLMRLPFGSQIRVGLQVDMGVILAVSAIPVRVGKVVLE